MFRWSLSCRIGCTVCQSFRERGVVGITTRYGLEGVGIESVWGRNFMYPPIPALGPTKLPIKWIPGLFAQWKNGRNVVLTTHPHQLLRLKKEFLSLREARTDIFSVHIWSRKPLRRMQKHESLFIYKMSI